SEFFCFGGQVIAKNHFGFNYLCYHRCCYYRSRCSSDFTLAYKKSFKEGWKITSLAVLILISILTTMVFIVDFENAFSLSDRHALIAVAISVFAIIICLYLIIKKTFKKKLATTSLYIIGFLLLLSVPILIMSSDLYSTVLWQFGASFFIILIIILSIIAPIIGFIIYLLKGDTFINRWKLSSVFLTIILLLFSTPVFIIQFITETPKVEQLDQQYEEMKDNLPLENSIDKVLVEVYKDGSFHRNRVRGRLCRSISASANFILKNYNENEFKGTITIKAILNGKKIGEKEVKIEALSNSEDSNSVSARELNITKETWDDVEFDYTLDGEFVAH